MAQADLETNYTNHCRIGTVVLTPSLDPLFIDEEAHMLLGPMARGCSKTATGCWPLGLMAFCRDIARSLVSTSSTKIIQHRRVIPLPNSSPVHVSGFGLPSSDGRDKRIVLVMYGNDPRTHRTFSAALPQASCSLAGA